MFPNPTKHVFNMLLNNFNKAIVANLFNEFDKNK